MIETKNMFWLIFILCFLFVCIMVSRRLLLLQPSNTVQVKNLKLEAQRQLQFGPPTIPPFNPPQETKNPFIPVPLSISYDYIGITAENKLTCIIFNGQLYYRSVDDPIFGKTDVGYSSNLKSHILDQLKNYTVFQPKYGEYVNYQFKCVTRVFVLEPDSIVTDTYLSYITVDLDGKLYVILSEKNGLRPLGFREINTNFKLNSIAALPSEVLVESKIYHYMGVGLDDKLYLVEKNFQNIIKPTIDNTSLSFKTVFSVPGTSGTSLYAVSKAAFLSSPNLIQLLPHDTFYNIKTKNYDYFRGTSFVEMKKSFMLSDKTSYWIEILQAGTIGGSSEEPGFYALTKNIKIIAPLECSNMKTDNPNYQSCVENRLKVCFKECCGVFEIPCEKYFDMVNLCNLNFSRYNENEPFCTDNSSPYALKFISYTCDPKYY